MDKFVVRLPRSLPGEASRPKERATYKQMTIHDLRGVVVVEDVLRLKAQLELNNQATEVLLSALHEISGKQPSVKVLQEIKIGRSVRRLSNHSDPQVAILARDICASWKSFIRERRSLPMIEVRSDAKTECLRQSARKLIAEALAIVETSLIVESIEREVYHQSHRILNSSYRRTIRKLVFRLRAEDATAESVRLGNISSLLSSSRH
ncbi:PREDICTED: transcription elongation factor A N-terminal and central domain-containing protein 2-like [Priapulus caudatus]|uniref:Transcription elongation factor A N-terminal and central domain-containing protein 2-like n=1 Tax=Priapulus caudatus TaxID=37621 RepID=A0ABM1E3U3_PRICU|nr:PREDICTED: transcription elongation factor A N-terminal and central domain-containing protein 2-like [Priapulus caudatus]